ncbi:hypothetical protein B2J93_252 [Marssonina coronariae]|uniref:NEDD8-activating enzyme E1 catalytic subunit n=1 Tax=Diplocarpon coronariae TaxID=2795749 RepID=A0A218Z148_9HELO|nr:hypothetical protein B2J93_252 [Marssonina coronariae]
MPQPLMVSSTIPLTLSNSSSRWLYLNNFLRHTGPFTSEEFETTDEAATYIERVNILVIGAGGLGCEILKNLALSGFKKIHVIDMDTIDVSNLNRQFLFRQADIGKSKAEVAAKFVEKRVKGVSITPHNCKIQDKDDDFYMKFNIVICGLDSIEARRWINSTLVNLVDGDNPESLKPLIDGGTEGFKGQSRVIFPTVTSCIECQLDMHAPRAAVPLCTLATIPRQPEHCIEWAHIIAWEQEKPFPALDNDDPEHIGWLLQKALARAKEFNISGVTYSLTQGVVKNIIPAIASTNAIIAASCCNEAFKIATSTNPFLGFEENYMMYSGNEGIYTYTFKHEKKDDCPVCGNLARDLEVDPNFTLQEFIDSLAARPEAQLKKPSIRSGDKVLYMQSPESLRLQLASNLTKKIYLLIANSQEIGVTDPSLGAVSFKFRIKYSQEVLGPIVST